MILVVDDHGDTCRGVVTMLRQMGYDALGLMDGQRAIDHLRDAKPDLIILDCNMPCPDGVQVLRHVRADPRLGVVPVIMYSGDARPDLRVEAEQLGIQGWIIKASSGWDELARYAELYGVRGDGRGAPAS